MSAVGGIRFDGNGDPINRDEAKTYLAPYYGQGANSVRQWELEYPEGSGSIVHNGPRYKHLTEIAEDKEHFEHGAWAFFSLKWQGTPRLNALVYGAFNNITKFDWYGYGKLGETVSYDIVPRKLTAGITFEQEFYGSDVFSDHFVIANSVTSIPAAGSNPEMRITMTQAQEIVTSPYLKFSPTVSYNLTPVVRLTLDGHYGICQDVLEFDYSIKPSVNISLGQLQLNIFYMFYSQKYNFGMTSTGNMDVNVSGTWMTMPLPAGVSAPPLPQAQYDSHKLGIGLMLIF